MSFELMFDKFEDIKVNSHFGHILNTIFKSNPPTNIWKWEMNFYRILQHKSSGKKYHQIFHIELNQSYFYSFCLLLFTQKERMKSGWKKFLITSFINRIHKYIIVMDWGEKKLTTITRLTERWNEIRLNKN